MIRWIKTLVVCCILTNGFSIAQQTGSDPDVDRQRVLELYLDDLGHPPYSYEIPIAWTELVMTGPETFVYGYRIRPRAGSEAFDVYLTEAGDVLSTANLDSLGIRPKRWHEPPVEQPAETPGRVATRIASPPTPVGPKRSLPVSGAVLLPDVDLESVLAEDLARKAEQGKGATRIGIVQEIGDPVIVDGEYVSHGFWQSLTGGGHLWSVALFSPDALGMRVHFDRIELPDGAALLVYNANDPGEVYGPYPESGGIASDLWSATCFTDMTVVECFVPADVERESVRLTIDRIVHNYVPFGEYARAKAAGACNRDVTCYPAWADAATGVGGVGSVGGNGSFFCSGCLIADTDTTSNIPYFLTANHCVASVSQATTLEFYWLYQTSTCNGVPPSPATVPRTLGGAQFLATSAASEGTDFTLLRLNNDPPTGLTFLGWSSAPTALGTTTTCIHHPSVDFKRITFGVVTDVNESLRGIRPAERYYQSSWTLGTTEPGSSGSPLMIEATQQIIGQLWGGPGSCTTSTNLDYYGRFDVGYPLIAAYLNPVTVQSITVTRPNAAKSWPIGDRRGIRWTSTGIGGKIRIELWRNGSFVQVIKNGTKNDGKARWNIDPGLEPGGGYNIRIMSKSNAGIYDDSDALFTLFTPEPPAP
jgi:hypothetical protein